MFVRISVIAMWMFEGMHVLFFSEIYDLHASCFRTSDIQFELVSLTERKSVCCLLAQFTSGLFHIQLLNANYIELVQSNNNFITC